MDVLHIIMLLVAIAAVIGVILSLCGFAGFGPASEQLAAAYNLEPAVWLVVSAAVLLADAVVWLLATLWSDPGYRPLAVILGLGFTLHVAVAAWRLGLARVVWRKARALASPPQAGEVKKPWVSKTIVLNAVVGAALLAEANIASLQGLLPQSKYQIIAFGLPFVNMLLRAYTTKGLSLKPKDEATA